MTRAPDLAEPVLGFRAFEVGADLRLHSLTRHGTVWRPGVVTAYCRRTRLTGWATHAAPGRTCTCGLYAYTQLDPRLKDGDWCIAAVAAWGSLEVHSIGFRAQHACVVAVAAAPPAGLPKRELIARCAERYGVKSVALRKLPEEALRHARPLGPLVGLPVEVVDLARA